LGHLYPRGVLSTVYGHIAEGFQHGSSVDLNKGSLKAAAPHTRCHCLAHTPCDWVCCDLRLCPGLLYLRVSSIHRLLL
jgi:hypothetical protein